MRRSVMIGLVLTCTLVSLWACPPRRYALEVSVPPNDDQIFKLTEDLDFESWQFGLELRPAEALKAIEGVRLTYFAGDQVLLKVFHDKRSLEARAELQPLSPRSTVLRDFADRLPASLKVDRVRVEVDAHGLWVPSRDVPMRRYKQQHRYRLPIEGCWLVAAGHEFGAEHRRWYNRSHFAWDLVKVDANGDPAAAGCSLTDYLAFGQPVLAPADGVVVFAEDRYMDRKPGDPAPAADANFVLIDHGDGEYSKLAHLMQSSLLVKPGDHVRIGQHIARVGNSGESDAPHLHVHFQGLVRDADGVIVSEPPLPIRFNNYTATSNHGVRVSIDSGRPRRGEFVCATNGD